jgi:hypothetical protein
VKGRNYWGDLSVAGKIILKWFLKDEYLMV